MEARTGSLTVAALLGTGLATLGFALSGVSALGDDLQAARTNTPAPVLSPGEEGESTAPSTTPSAAALELEAVCDREKRRHHHAPGGVAGTSPADDEPVASAAKAY